MKITYEKARFIASSRTIIPQLLDEVEKYRKALESIANNPYQYGMRVQAFKRKAQQALGESHE